MSAREPRHGSPGEEGEPLEEGDGLDEFIPKPGPTEFTVNVRVAHPHAAPPAATARASFRGRDVAARPPRLDSSPELVWLEGAEGLEAFLPDSNRSVSPVEIAPDTATPIAVLSNEPIACPPAEPLDAPELRAAEPRTGPAAHPIRLDWMVRAGRAALVCAVVAAAVDQFAFVEPPPGPQTAAPMPQPLNTTRRDTDYPEPTRPSAQTVQPTTRTVAVETGPRPGKGVVRGRRESPSVEAQRLVASTGRGAGLRTAATARSSPRPVAVTAQPAVIVRPPTPVPRQVLASAPLTPTVAQMAATSADAPAAPAVLPPTAPEPTVATSLSTATLRAAPPGAADAPARAASREPEARAIERVLGHYRTAFNTLDASAATAVWPTVDEKTLARAFERLADQNVSFENCQIDVAGVLAEVACRGSARYVPKVGSRTSRAEARRWTFTLRKASRGWLIDRVSAR